MTERATLRAKLIAALQSVHADAPHDYADACLSVITALEAAGVRLVPVNEKPGQGWLHEAVKDACLRASKNSGGTPPQLLYAPILWAMQDALAASPYAPEQKDESR